MKMQNCGVMNRVIMSTLMTAAGYRVYLKMDLFTGPIPTEEQMKEYSTSMALDNTNEFYANRIARVSIAGNLHGDAEDENGHVSAEAHMRFIPAETAIKFTHARDGEITWALLYGYNSSNTGIGYTGIITTDIGGWNGSELISLEDPAANTAGHNNILKDIKTIQFEELMTTQINVR